VHSGVEGKSALMADDKEPEKKSNEVSTWLSEIARAQKTMQTWTVRCE
jgi:hypothetical protein